MDAPTTFVGCTFFLQGTSHCCDLHLFFRDQLRKILQCLQIFSTKSCWMKSLGITWYRTCSCRLHGLTCCVSISLLCWISSITPYPHNYLVQFHCGSMHGNTENMPDSIFLFVKPLGFPTKLHYIWRGHTVLKHFRLNCSPRIMGEDSILNFDRSLCSGFGSTTKDVFFLMWKAHAGVRYLSQKNVQ